MTNVFNSFFFFFNVDCCLSASSTGECNLFFCLSIFLSLFFGVSSLKFFLA